MMNVKFRHFCAVQSDSAGAVVGKTETLETEALSHPFHLK